ncbi:MAG: BlaI/MecI/CopY family transcriptional regulator [Oscillospiraceae bacterium]|nr:BlaI/MecI/CopY family transcriptional regulator [Oscillospiraceae bacterium]
MITIPRISEAEWQIMKILWEKSPMVFSEIKEKLDPLFNWKENTIHTMLTRLVNKGALKIVETKPLKKYAPIVTENECVSAETESFLNRVYNGSLDKLVTGFIENKKLSEKEIDELKKILDEARLEE